MANFSIPTPKNLVANTFVKSTNITWNYISYTSINYTGGTATFINNSVFNNWNYISGQFYVLKPTFFVRTRNRPRLGLMYPIY